MYIYIHEKKHFSIYLSVAVLPVQVQYLM